jgi:hypothetical protein
VIRGDCGHQRTLELGLDARRITHAAQLKLAGQVDARRISDHLDAIDV